MSFALLRSHFQEAFNSSECPIPVAESCLMSSVLWFIALGAWGDGSALGLFIRCVSLAFTDSSREVLQRNKGNKSQEWPAAGSSRSQPWGVGLRSRKFRLASSPFLQTLLLKKEACATLNYKNPLLELWCVVFAKSPCLAPGEKELESLRPVFGLLRLKLAGLQPTLSPGDDCCGNSYVWHSQSTLQSAQNSHMRHPIPTLPGRKDKHV